MSRRQKPSFTAASPTLHENANLTSDILSRPYFSAYGAPPASIASPAAMLWLIDRVTPVKVDALAERRGLDNELHGEQAYVER
jgi:ammonia channel protein AmtB